jgi:hypothetical protein
VIDLVLRVVRQVRYWWHDIHVERMSEDYLWKTFGRWRS